MPVSRDRDKLWPGRMPYPLDFIMVMRKMNPAPADRKIIMTMWLKYGLAPGALLSLLGKTQELITCNLDLVDTSYIILSPEIDIFAAMQ